MVTRLPAWLLAGLLVALSAHAHARCGTDALNMSAIQGSGPASPMAGETVTVEGVITMDSRHQGGWRGFYLQQPDGNTDNNPQTSDALFIYTDRAGGEVGTRVRVTGRVKEYHGLTELTRVSDLSVCGPGELPAPIPVTLPWPGGKPPEHLENMHIQVTSPLTLIGHYGFARYGELILADRPQVTPTEILPPGPEARKLAGQQALNRLHLDDGNSTRNPDPLPWPASLLAAGEPVRAGDRLGGLTGILDYRFGHWRLQPSKKPELVRQTARPDPPPEKSPDTLRVVTLNLENLFNGNGKGAGFANSRGARNAREFAAQLSRVTATLKAMDADVIAAVEVENDGYDSTSAIAGLAAALGPQWSFVATPGATGTDAIRTDLLYRTDRAQPLGEPERLNGGEAGYRGRPAVAQLFRPAGEENSKAMRVVVAHFKSKACGGATGADRDQKDGQGCYARRRTEAAGALAQWLASLPQPANFAGNLVTGDLNSYAREQPIRRLEQAGLVNLVRSRHPCDADNCPYTSYRYQGRKGSLDYNLASESLSRRVTDAGVWAINAEEFPAIGYRGPLPSPADAPWRSSDHNPLFSDIKL
jgi:predicted extracellular nuclease